MIKRKNKLCKCGCGKTGLIWARGMLKDCDRKQNPEKHGLSPKESKPRRYIAPVSKSQAKRLSEYRKKRDRYMKDHPICEFPQCNQPSQDLHHVLGRIGKNLTDETKFKALCRPCHCWVEDHPLEAKELGMSENRI